MIPRWALSIKLQSSSETRSGPVYLSLPLGPALLGIMMIGEAKKKKRSKCTSGALFNPLFQFCAPLFAFLSISSHSEPIGRYATESSLLLHTLKVLYCPFATLKIHSKHIASHRRCSEIPDASPSKLHSARACSCTDRAIPRNSLANRRLRRLAPVSTHARGPRIGSHPPGCYMRSPDQIMQQPSSSSINRHCLDSVIRSKDALARVVLDSDIPGAPYARSAQNMGSTGAYKDDSQLFRPHYSTQVSQVCVF